MIEPREGERLGRNIREQLAARPQPEDLAPCGQFNCAGCYDIGEGKKIHPPRNGYENKPPAASHRRE